MIEHIPENLPIIARLKNERKISHQEVATNGKNITSLSPIQQENGHETFNRVRNSQVKSTLLPSLSETPIYSATTQQINTPGESSFLDTQNTVEGVVLTEHTSSAVPADLQLPEIKTGKLATFTQLRRAHKELQRKGNTKKTESSATEDQRITEVRELVKKLKLFQGNSEMYARQRVKKELSEMNFVSPLEIEYEEKDLMNEIKSQTMIALLQLDQIQTMEPGKRELMKDMFRKTWGETGDDYFDIYKSTQRTASESTGITEEEKQNTRSDATSIIADFSIPVDRKIELFMKAGFSRKEAVKAVLFTGGALFATTVISSVAESGATLSALSTNDAFIPGLEIPRNVSAIANDLKSIGVDAAALSGFYATTAAYAKIHALMTEKTGIGMNVWATGMHYIDKALGVSKKEIRKDMIKTIFMVNLMLDLPYLSTALIPQIGPSMMANAYKFGIEITAAQAAICASVLTGAKALETIRNSSFTKTGRETYERIELPHTVSQTTNKSSQIFTRI